jgi:3-hydroxybutyryl-CoA dehydrogenase
MTLQIGVVGAGYMGRGIATCAIANGLAVRVFDLKLTDEVDLAIEHGLRELLEHGFIQEHILTGWRSLYHAASSISELADCDFVIETVAENIEIKQKVFDELEAVIRPDVPLVSNTSAIPISLMQKSRKHPERFAGMHFAPPAHISRFLEVVRGEKTNDAIIKQIMDLAGRMGKEPALLQRDIEGFIVNRLGYAMYREALHLLESGVADAATIDSCWRNVMGTWCAIAGPFRWMDLTGAALYAAGMRRIFPTLCNSTEVPRTMLELEKKGLMGTRDLKGFYTYTKDEAEKWDQTLVEESWRARTLQDKLFPTRKSP